jgi:hypothetical protein
LSGPGLARNLAWWRRLRENGTTDTDIRDAVLGLRKVVRVNRPWWPCRMLGKKTNEPLWLEAIGAARKVQRNEPTALGAILKQIGDR